MVNFDIVKLLSHIPNRAVRKKALKGEQDYLGIRLVVGPDTIYTDSYIYVGKSSQLNPDSLKKRIGLIVQNDIGLDLTKESIEYIELTDDVNVLELYEKLKEQWCLLEISNSVKALTTMLGSRTINDIIDSSSKLLNNPIFILNKRNELLAYSCTNQVDEPNISYMLEHGHLSPEHVRAAHLSSASAAIKQSKEPLLLDSIWETGRKNIVGIIRRAGIEEGTVIVSEYNRELSEYDVDVVGSICTFLSNLISAPPNRNVGLADLMYEQNFNAVLEQRNLSDSWISGWLSYLNWSERKSYYLFAIELPSWMFESLEIINLRARLLEIPSSYNFLYLRDRNLIIMVNARTKSEFLKCTNRLEPILQEYSISAGVSSRFENIHLLNESYSQAVDAMRIKDFLNDRGLINRFEDTLVYDLLMQQSAQVRQYEDYRLRTLEEYDRRFGTDYYQTLYTYFQNAFDKSRTAEKLFIHRNTLPARLLKIEEILETDLKDGEECLRLYLGFKLRELSRAQRLADCQGKCDLVPRHS